MMPADYRRNVANLRARNQVEARKYFKAVVSRELGQADRT
jgi:hypothetical protein